MSDVKETVKKQANVTEATVKTKELLTKYCSTLDIEERREIENEILILNERLCYSVVLKHRFIKIEHQDAMQVARIGMLKAIQNYNPKKKRQFSTLAVTVMQNDLINVHQYNNRSKREAVNLSLDYVLEDGSIFSEVAGDGSDLEKASADRLLVRQIIQESKDILSEREYQVFLYYLDLVPNSPTRTEMAKSLKISASHFSITKKDAFRKIRKKFTYV